MAQIQAPPGGGNIARRTIAGVTFDGDGVGHTTAAGPLAYFRRKGYLVDGEAQVETVQQQLLTEQGQASLIPYFDPQSPERLLRRNVYDPAL